MNTSDGNYLDFQQLMWQRKPSLRAVYQDYYRRILDVLKSGRTLEVGGGIGKFREYGTNIISSDIVFSAWLDVVADAHELPFVEKSFENIVAIDTLHHLDRPIRFFREATRLLRSGGRLILLEPAITPVSGIIYRWFHPEPVDMTIDPLADGPLDRKSNPNDGNQAIATLLVSGKQNYLEETFSLNVIQCHWISLFAYPLTGGFSGQNLIPSRLVRPVLAFEGRIARILGPLCGFRLFLVFERLQR